MRVIVHVSGHYSWEPVPGDVKVTDEDLKAGRARAGAHGGHLMRVPKKVDTYCEFHLSEREVIAQVIQAYTEHGKCGAILTRKEAVARYLATRMVPNESHPRWFKSIEVHDEGPNEKQFRDALAPHVAADHGRAPGKNVDAEDVEDLVKAYMETADHAAHLTDHFRVKGASK